jgi:flagellar assembly protein FliH
MLEKLLSPEAEVTRSLSRNLLKVGYTNVQDGEKRVIDSNGLMTRRMEALAVQAKRSEKEELGTGEDGFAAGLAAERVEGLFSEEDSEDGIQSNVIKANVDKDAAQAEESAEAAKAASEILEQAREQAKSEAEQILAQARESLEREREEALSQAREQGLEEGRRQAETELAEQESALEEKRKALDAEYDALSKELEPKLVDAIADVYEHIFHVELSSYREILLYLIESAVRKIEGGKDFLVHVSGEDYPYVRMEKKEIEAAVTSPGATLEIVEDITLGRNECLIETDGGIFDCGLGTQLDELKKKLKLLSFETLKS